MSLRNENGNVIAEQVERMDTSIKRARGLLKFQAAPKSYAAVFKLPFCGFFPMVHTFRMKFSIDILFCDHDKRVVHRYLGVGPGKVILPIRHFFGGCPFLVELAGCDKGDIKLGEKISWEAA